MRITRLIEILQGIKEEFPRARICQAIDPEGNGFYVTGAVQKEYWNHREREVVHDDDAEGNEEIVVMFWP